MMDRSATLVLLVAVAVAAGALGVHLAHGVPWPLHCEGGDQAAIDVAGVACPLPTLLLPGSYHVHSTTTDCSYGSWTLRPSAAGRDDDRGVIVVGENRLGTSGPVAFHADFVLTSATRYTLTLPAFHIDWPGLVKGGPVERHARCSIDVTITGEPHGGVTSAAGTVSR